MEIFECAVCGYIYEGNLPPEKCPICKAPISKFEKRVNSDEDVQEPTNNITKYQCVVCGYIYEGNFPPEKCPICKAPALKFKNNNISDNCFNEEMVTNNHDSKSGTGCLITILIAITTLLSLI